MISSASRSAAVTGEPSPLYCGARSGFAHPHDRPAGANRDQAEQPGELVAGIQNTGLAQIEAQFVARVS